MFDSDTRVRIVDSDGMAADYKGVCGTVRATNNAGIVVQQDFVTEGDGGFVVCRLEQLEAI